MKLSGFTIYILILAMGSYQAYSLFAMHFSGLNEAKAQLRMAHRELEREQLRTALALHQTSELEQSVAAIIPDFLKSTHDHGQVYGLRTLASTANPFRDEDLHIELATTTFEQGRSLFREGKFGQANERFSQIIEKHPLSIHIVESYFLSIEGLYQIHEYPAMIHLVESMMNRYPDHVLTGFALIRLARVLKEADRSEDAEEVLQTILKFYDDKDLVAQTHQNLKEMEL